MDVTALGVVEAVGAVVVVAVVVVDALFSVVAADVLTDVTDAVLLLL